MERRQIKWSLTLLLYFAVFSSPLINIPRIEATMRTRPIVISIVPKSLDNPMFIEVKEAAELTAQRLNVVLEWVGPFKMDVDTQIQIIEGLIRRKVDGIAVSCSDEERLRAVIDQAVASGIKVVTMGADAPKSKRLFYCGTDNYQAGVACGEAMVRLVTQKGWAERELKVAVLTGGLNAHNQRERIRGFKAATAGRINVNYQAMLVCNDDITTAAKEVEAYIRKHPETDAFFFTGGWAFLGPPEAMPFYDQWCRNGGIAVSMDTCYPVLEAAQRGFAQALVGQDFKKMGEFTVSYLVCAVKDLPYPEEFIDTGLEIVDQTDFERLILTRRPWDIK